MEEKTELTERQELCKRLAAARRYHRLSVRWLFDVSRLASMYEASNTAWRGGNDAELCEVAQKDYEDAQKEVIQTRELVDIAHKKLKEYDENERHIQESE